MNIAKIYKTLTKTKDNKKRYVLYHMIQEEIKKRMDTLKQSILEKNNFKKIEYPELKRKISIVKEKGVAEYDIVNIANEISKESFYSIINIMAKKVELLPKEEQEIVLKYKKIEGKENKTLKVEKM